MCFIFNAISLCSDSLIYGDLAFYIKRLNSFLLCSFTICSIDLCCKTYLAESWFSAVYSFFHSLFVVRQINIFTSASAAHASAVFHHGHAFMGIWKLDWNNYLPSCIYIWMIFCYSSASPETPSALPPSPRSVPGLMLFCCLSWRVSSRGPS